MDERAELQASIERTQEALADKAHQLEQRVVDRVVDVKQQVAHALDVPGLYRERPWPFVITAMLTGLVTGACWSPRSAARHALGDD